MKLNMFFCFDIFFQQKNVKKYKNTNLPFLQILCFFQKTKNTKNHQFYSAT